jgi:hypothetical protein
VTFGMPTRNSGWRSSRQTSIVDSRPRLRRTSPRRAPRRAGTFRPGWPSRRLCLGAGGPRRTLLALHRDADAIAAFERALTTQPGLNDVRRRVEVFEVPVARARNLAAARGGEGGAGDEASSSIAPRSASPESRSSSGTGVGRGRAWRDRRRVEHLRRAVELDPSDAVSLGQMARIFQPVTMSPGAALV